MNQDIKLPQIVRDILKLTISADLAGSFLFFLFTTIRDVPFGGTVREELTVFVLSIVYFFPVWLIFATIVYSINRMMK